jgi:hypothetical protein
LGEKALLPLSQPHTRERGGKSFIRGTRSPIEGIKDRNIFLQNNKITATTRKETTKAVFLYFGPSVHYVLCKMEVMLFGGC